MEKALSRPKSELSIPIRATALSIILILFYILVPVVLLNVVKISKVTTGVAIAIVTLVNNCTKVPLTTFMTFSSKQELERSEKRYLTEKRRSREIYFALQEREERRRRLLTEAEEPKETNSTSATSDIKTR